MDEAVHGIGDRLKAWRLTQKHTQTSAAELLGMPMRTYQNYENNVRPPNTKAWEAFHRAGINTNWLLSGEGEMLVADMATVRPDLQREEAEWQVVKLALATVSFQDLLLGDTSSSADAFVRAYNSGQLTASLVLRERIPQVSAQDLRDWATVALRWRHRWETAQISRDYEYGATSKMRAAAEPSFLLDQPGIVDINRAVLARYLAALRPAIEQTLMDRPTAAAVIAELYSQEDSAANPRVRDLLTGVLRGIWRSQAEKGTPVTSPTEEANAIADICRQLGLHGDDQTKGLTRSAG